MDTPSAVADTVTPDVAERLAPGTMAGEYKIEEHVGAGAMGDVYRAVHPMIGKRAAIKVIKRKLVSSPEALERFVREARAVNRVEHPNVVDVFAMGRLSPSDDRLFLAMDFLDGESLGRRLRAGGPLVIEKAIEILRPVCAALDAAHQKKVVHRDLKTDNIFLDEHGRVYVLDFGIAKVLAEVAPGKTGGGLKSALTTEGSWIGTPAYMAPEQWTSDGAGTESDIYSLGIVAYEMLTGHPPFTASNLPALMEQHFRAEPPEMSTPSGGLRVPEAVEQAIRHALAKQPADRPASAMAFLRELEQGAGMATTGYKPGGARTAAGPRRRGGSRMAALLGGGVLVAGAGAAFVLTRPHPPAPPQIKPVDATECSISLSSRPTGALLTRDGSVIGKTPQVVHAAAGATLVVTVAHPGYEPQSQSLVARPDQAVEIALVPVRGFEGTWEIPGQGHLLRAFERTGEQVSAYGLDKLDGEKKFMRFFTFVDAPLPAGDVAFSALEELVEPKLPNEPSCHFLLGAEYHFSAKDDRLELRRQVAPYVVEAGKCRLKKDPAWTEYEPAKRLAGGEQVTTISSQGASGNASLVNVITPDPNADSGAKSNVNKLTSLAGQTKVTKPVQKKAIPPKPAPPPPQKQQLNAPDKAQEQLNAPPAQGNAPPQQQTYQQSAPAQQKSGSPLPDMKK